MTFKSLDKSSDPAVSSTFYSCPVTGTKNITISLSFKTDPEFFKPPEPIKTFNGAGLPSVLTTEQLKTLADIKPFKLETLNLNSLSTKGLAPLYSLNPAEDYSHSWSNPCWPPYTPSDSIDKLLTSLSAEYPKKDSKKDIVKQIQALLEKLID